MRLVLAMVLFYHAVNYRLIRVEPEMTATLPTIDDDMSHELAHTEDHGTGDDCDHASVDERMSGHALIPRYTRDRGGFILAAS